jgi:hypothetical protein
MKPKYITIPIISILLAIVFLSLTCISDNITGIASILVALVAFKSILIGSNFSLTKYFKHKQQYLNWYRFQQKQSFELDSIYKTSTSQSKLSTRFIQATRNSTIDTIIQDEVLSLLLKIEHTTCDTGCGKTATVFLCDKCASCDNCDKIKTSNDVINPDEPT